jgi:hypothetical protein
MEKVTNTVAITKFPNVKLNKEILNGELKANAPTYVYNIKQKTSWF